MARTSSSTPSPEEVSAGALFLLPFILLQGGLFVFAPWDGRQMAQSDPLTQLFNASVGVWFIAVLSVVVVVAWNAVRPPRRSHVRAAGVRALAGAAGAAILLIALAGATAGVMPSFIPAEESAKPGLLLGLSAGVLEEVAFRLVLLPALYFGSQRWNLGRLGAVGAVVLTGLCFALSHEIGPGAGESLRLDYFTTRWIVPGCAMSVLFLVAGPAFILAAHCAAHLLIPLLFR